MTGKMTTYPGCSFPVFAMAQAEAELDRRLGERAPFSMIRIGDGEGAVLSRPEETDEVLWSWARRTLGKTISPDRLSALAEALQDAIDTADLIGIRDDIANVQFLETCFDLDEDQFLTRFQSSFRLRAAERHKGYPSALRIALTHAVLGRYRFSGGTRFTSAWVHFHLSSSGALSRYLAGEKRPALISGRPRLAAELKRALGRKIDYYELPGDYPSAAGHRAEGGGGLDAYLDAFRQTGDRVRVRYPGQLFLVGGGIWSKAICSRIKTLGGIALDIGSVCDAWIGLPTRPLVYKSMYAWTSGAVPECLLLSTQMKERAFAG